MIVLMVALAGAELTRLIRTLLSRYTNEDHALLWLAASDWMRLRPREPTFYGQPYGVTFEAIPVGLMNLLGISFGTAFPVALIGMALVAWVLLAAAALKRGLWLGALFAAAAPVLLSTDHWIIVGVIGTGVGRLLAAVSLSIVLVPTRNPIYVGLAIAAGTYAVAIDTAAIMIAVPGLVWGVFDWIKLRRRFVIPALLGVVPAVAWRLYLMWYEAKYADHALHGGWDANPDVASLIANYTNLDQLFAVHAPELLRYGVVYLGCGALALVLAVAALQLRAILTVASYVGLLVLLAAMPKSLDGSPSLWFPHARMTIAAPIGLWFILTISVHACAQRWLRAELLAGPIVRIGLPVLLFCVLATTSVSRASTWNERMHAIESVGLERGPISLRQVEAVYALCSTVTRVAQENQTRIVLFPGNRAANYACAALDRSLLTATPDYERRYWVLRSLAKKSVTRMIVWDVPAKQCRSKRYRRAVKACVPVADGAAVLLEFEPRPALDVIHQLNFRVRPFGPGCHPITRVGCEWWAARWAS